MATVTVNLPDPQVPRILAAYGDYLNLGRDATAAEVKAQWIAEAKSVVRAYELKVAHEAIVAPPDVTPT